MKSYTNKAQSMVEFALALPLLLLIVWGAIEVFHLIYVMSTVTLASRDAARYAAGVGGSVGSEANWQDCQGIRNAVEQAGSFLGIGDNDIQISFDQGPGTTSTQVCNGNDISIPQVNRGDRVTVSVTAYYTPWVPLAQFNPITLSSSSSRTILTDIIVGSN